MKINKKLKRTGRTLNEVNTTVNEDVLNQVSKVSDGFLAPIHIVGESMSCETV